MLIMIAMIGFVISTNADNQCPIKGVTNAYAIAGGIAYRESNSYDFITVKVTVNAYGVSNGAVNCYVDYTQNGNSLQTNPQVITFSQGKGIGFFQIPLDSQYVGVNISGGSCN